MDMELRAELRFPVTCAVTYSGYKLELEGTVKNVSLGGFGLESREPIRPGTPLFLTISLPDRDEPLEIELATVRWSRNGELGVKTVIMGLDSRTRLESFLEERLPRHETADPASAATI